MGMYVNCSDGRVSRKAEYLVENHDARIVSMEEARQAMNDDSLGVVCIKDNSFFVEGLVN